MKRRFSIISVLIAVCGMLMSTHCCKKPDSVAPLVSGKIEETKACVNDADCAVVKADCCGCLQGGKQTAIAQKAAMDWDSELAKTCGENICIQMISNDPSCKMKAACISGTCQLK